MVSFLFLSSLNGQTFIEQFRFGGSGSESGLFNRPSAISISPDGIVYVVDSGNNRIQSFNLKGRLLKTIGGFGFNDDQFNQPLDVWARSVINIYISDYNNRRVQRYDRHLNFLSSLKSEEGLAAQFQFYEVVSCAVSSQNDLFLLERGENKIVKFNRHGRPERVFGNYESGEGQLLQPAQLDIVAENRLLISDAGRRAVIVFDFFGNYLLSINHPDFNYPTGLAVSGDGRIMVADAAAQKIFIIAADMKRVKSMEFYIATTLKEPRDAALWEERIGKEQKIEGAGIGYSNPDMSLKMNREKSTGIGCANPDKNTTMIKMMVIDGNWVIAGEIVEK